MLELAVRDDNEHVGSGLGGNNFQFVVLTSLDHHLTDEDVKIAFHNNTMYWGETWLESASMKEIRKELDSVFEQVSPKYKEMADDFIKMKLFSFLEKHQDYFPIILERFNTKSGESLLVYDEVTHLCTNIEKLIIVRHICAALAAELDVGNNQFTSSIAKFITNFSPDINLYSIRTQITIDRLVRHNLDEHADFNKIIEIVNSLFESYER